MSKILVFLAICGLIGLLFVLNKQYFFAGSLHITIVDAINSQPIEGAAVELETQCSFGFRSFESIAPPCKKDKKWTGGISDRQGKVGINKGNILRELKQAGVILTVKKDGYGMHSQRINQYDLKKDMLSIALLPAQISTVKEAIQRAKEDNRVKQWLDSHNDVLEGARGGSRQWVVEFAERSCLKEKMGKGCGLVVTIEPISRMVIQVDAQGEIHYIPMPLR